jgi:hypothetical protein
VEKAMPKCPHCDGALTIHANPEGDAKEVRREIKGRLKKEALYFCPHCDKVLGFAYFFGG